MSDKFCACRREELVARAREAARATGDSVIASSQVRMNLYLESCVRDHCDILRLSLIQAMLTTCCKRMGIAQGSATCF